MLDAPLARAREGRGASVFISGEAGIGKTALVEAFVDALNSASTRPLWGACEALATPRPLGPLIAAGWKGQPACEKLHEDDKLRVFRCVLQPGGGHERHFHPAHYTYV